MQVEQFRTLTRGNSVDISIYVREMTISMYKEITAFLMSEQWNARELCGKWISDWEQTLFTIQDNPAISVAQYEEYARYAIRRIMELCDTFDVADLYEKYLVD
jgi:hypothetical protein